MKKIFFFLAALMLTFTAQATIVECNPGTNNLAWYLTQGDTLVLADGIYEEAYSIAFNKLGVCVKAAEGAKPVIKLTGEYTVLDVQATTTFEGITFDAGNVAKYLVATTGVNPGTLTINNCEFRNWTYWALSNQFEETASIDSVIVNNTIFHDGAEAAISFNNKAPEGLHSCNYFSLTNSTIYNVKSTEYAGIVHVSSNGEATGKQNTIIIDHVTMYNLDGADLGIIAVRKSSDLTISNTIIANPAEGERASYVYGGAAENVIYYNVSQDGDLTYTNCLTDDPKFVDAANGDFALDDGSPALGAGTDGSNLGDPRWNVVAEPEPTTETVYFIDVKEWGKVNAYAWTTDPIVAWPGAAATKEAEQIAGYDVYSYTLDAGAAANVIFNDGSSQTPDLVWTAGKYYVIDMGWLTKEEAETKLAAPLPETWNIVGDAGLMGKGWDLNAAENAMTKQGDGTYLLEKKDITITAGTYEYKAAKDHGWTVSVPQDGNQKLTISKSGIYDITFVLNVTAKTLQATATLKKEAVVIPTVIIAGDMNGWDQNKDKFTMAADSLTATFKATLTAKSYAFKMIVGGAWHSDGKTITRAANSTKFTGANSNTNSTLKADIAGDYLFTWEYATKTLTVTYPALPVKYNVTVTAENGTVTGAGEYEEGKTATLTATPAEGYQFVNWTVGEEVVSTENPYSFVVTADVALVANFAVVEPEVIAYELNGGVLPAPAVPTNEELWIAFMPYYQEYYDVVRAEQPIASVAVFLSAGMGDDATIFTSEDSDYKWLGDYIIKVTTEQSAALTTLANWKFNAQAFFNANQYTGWPKSADFTEAGKPENWGAAYEAAHEVVLPTEPVAEDYVLPTPVKEGYTFVGWYDNAEGTGEAYTVIPAGWAGTLYAIWKQGPTTALENIAVEGKAVKAIVNGQLIIIKNGVQYNVQGQVIK